MVKTTITNKDYERLKKTCPFDFELFYEENEEILKVFLKKYTLDFTIHDWDEEELSEDWWYRGMEGLLRAKVKKKDKYTLYQQLEWTKCALDVVYFVEKYIKIMSIDEGIIPFKLYDYQRKLLRLYQDNRFVLSLQSRQSGKTTVTAAFITWFGIFNQAKTIGILANKADQAQEILSRVQLGYESLPLFLQPGLQTYNKRSMKLGNDSVIFSASSASNSVRGKSLACVSENTNITIRDKETNEIKELSMSELEELLFREKYGDTSLIIRLDE